MDITYRSVYTIFMETDKSTQENSTESTREQILELATRLFSSKGYEAVGIQEIVNEAGITKPTLYYYFGSKKGLLQNIISQKSDMFIASLKKASEYHHDFIKGLTQILKATIDFAKNEPDFFRLHCILSWSPSTSEERGLYEPVMQNIKSIFTDFFTQSANEFGNMKGNEKLYATLFYTNVLAVSTLSAADETFTQDSTLYKIIHSFVYGVANG